jgi:hypothetical protein
MQKVASPLTEDVGTLKVVEPSPTPKVVPRIVNNEE